MLRVLVLDDDTEHANMLVRRILPPETETIVCPQWVQGVQILQNRISEIDLILVCLPEQSEREFRQLKILLAGCQGAGYRSGPRFLCILPIYRGPEFELRIEQLGIRVAYE